MPTLISRFLGLFALLLFSAQVNANSWWPFGPKATETSLKVTLEDYSGHVSTTSTGVLGVDVIYEFGEEMDRVSLASELYPHLDGVEIFKGRLQSVALKESNYEKATERLLPEIKKRVEFYSSHLEKRRYTTFRTKGKSYPLQTQSVFMSQSKTFVLEFDSKYGLLLLELNKVYERPADIEVFRPRILHDLRSEPGDTSHPLYRRQHFAVTVRHDRPGYIGSASPSWHANAENTFQAISKQARSYYEPFNDHLIKTRNYKVFDAVQALVHRQNEDALSEEDLKQLAIIDEYLLNLKKVPASAQATALKSNAVSPKDALGMRLLFFGAEPHDTWIFQFEPQLQRVESDFFAFEKDQGLWRGYSPEPDSRAAFIRTDRGLIAARSYSYKTYLQETSSTTAAIDFSLLGVGLSNLDQVRLSMSTLPEKFDAEIKRQVKAGIQGNSDTSYYLLEDLIACRDLLQPPHPEEK